jgi:hypothetical protein
MQRNPPHEIRRPNLALGKVKKASPDLRLKAALAVHERAYGRPAQNICLDIALKRAIEDKDPAEQRAFCRTPDLPPFDLPPFRRGLFQCGADGDRPNV